MSHFTVLVIGPDVEGQLARYDENLEVEPYQDRITNPWWAQNAYDEAGVLAGDLHGLQAFFDHRWPDSKGTVLLDDDGLYEWSTYSPDAKWDWYSVGGRWSGFLQLRQPESPTAEVLGQRVEALLDQERRNAHLSALGLKDDREVTPPGRADVARAGDVDWAHCGWVNSDTTYAVVAEGAWKAKAEMGWFGVNRTEADTRWDEWWMHLVTNLPTDTMVTVIDAHI